MAKQHSSATRAVDRAHANISRGFENARNRIADIPLGKKVLDPRTTAKREALFESVGMARNRVERSRPSHVTRGAEALDTAKHERVRNAEHHPVQSEADRKSRAMSMNTLDYQGKAGSMYDKPKKLHPLPPGKQSNKSRAGGKVVDPTSIETAMSGDGAGPSVYSGYGND